MPPGDPTFMFVALTVIGGFVITGLLLAIPFYAIWTYHKRKLEEIRAHRDVRVAEETRKAMDELREEFKQLRDNTSAYDVSLDNALQRLERRIENVEQRNRYGETATAVEQPIQYQVGRQ
jgi:hypothetical protein